MKTNQKAFTRVELIASIAALALLGGLAAPLLGTTRSDSNEAICFNNLRQIGYAVRVWGDDHGDRPPWLTRVSEGGTRPDTGTKPGNAWFEYAFLSNQLLTPKILACPADAGVQVAREWPEFSSSGFRANAVSYLLGLHCEPERPLALLAADRNVRVTSAGGTCGPAAINNISSLDWSDPNIAWTNQVHGSVGHLLKNDGSVEFATSSRLRSAVAEDRVNDNSFLHLLRAR